MAHFEFNSENVDPNNPEFQPVPAAVYTGMITASEIKENSKKTGLIMKLTVEIVEGEYKGRKIFDNLNIKNPNADAQMISERKLSALCRCVGVLNMKDTTELHNTPFKVAIGIRPARGEYKEANEIQGYIFDFEERAAEAKTASSTTTGNTVPVALEDDKLPGGWGK